MALGEGRTDKKEGKIWANERTSKLPKETNEGECQLKISGQGWASISTIKNITTATSFLQNDS